jgi:hypothetical protein
MKRKLLFALIALLFTASAAWAAGTLTVTGPSKTKATNEPSSEKRKVTVSWVANSGDASIGSATIAAITYGLEGWYLYSVDMAVGTTTSTADLVIGDTYTTDWSSGGLANIGTWTSYCFGTSPYAYKDVKGDLTFTITNNAVNSATGSAVLTFLPQ